MAESWRRAAMAGWLGVVLLAMAQVSARAQAPAPPPPRGAIQLNSFPGASNLPIWVAMQQGMFARLGLDVALSAAHGSVEQFKGVADGRYPVISTAFDNIIAYHEGRGAAEVGAIPDLVAVAGIDRGFLTLVVAPGISGVAALKGRTMAVDALATGFSFALKDILARGGVSPADVSYVAVGSSEGRWKALREGAAAAGLLSLPTDLDATDAGFTALTTVNQVFGHYLANVVATRQGWAAAHETEMTRFLRGLRQAMAWLAAPDNRAATLEILHREMPALDSGKVTRVYDELLDKQQGLLRDLALDPEGARTVLDLRERYAPGGKRPAAATLFMDTRFATAAGDGAATGEARP